MHRNLYYMKGIRSVRNNAGRKSFNINSMLERKLKEKEKKDKEDKGNVAGKSLVVGFLSYEDFDSEERFNREVKYVQVQTLLEKTSHNKKRKEGTNLSDSKDVSSKIEDS